MGLHFGSGPDRGLTDDVSPTLTAGEYVSALAGVMAALAERPRGRCHSCRLGLRYLVAGLPGPATLVFSAHVERYPHDGHAHRLLGLAHLSWGNLRPATKHLEVALGLLRREAAQAGGLGRTLQLQCEAALLRMMLVRLHSRLGQVQMARWLAREDSEVL